ncbi:MAG: hypothetical protein C4324_08510 [Blastocatellia bacterium]
MLTFYRYPKEHWVHIRTTNVVESPFAALRLRQRPKRQSIERAAARGRKTGGNRFGFSYTD